MKNLSWIVTSTILIACQFTPPEENRSAPLYSVANGINCDVDYSQLNTTPLDGITIVDQGINQKEKIRHLNELSAMSKEFLDVMRTRISINLTSGSITEFPKYAFLKGVVPRGWEATGKTWDDIPGGADGSAVFLGDSARPNGAASLAIHEATHSVDIALNIKQTAEFLDAYRREKDRPHPADTNFAYRLNYPEEYLAMAVEGYFCGAKTRADLKMMYPLAHEFVEQKLPQILTQGAPPTVISWHF